MYFFSRRISLVKYRSTILQPLGGKISALLCWVSPRLRAYGGHFLNDTEKPRRLKLIDFSHFYSRPPLSHSVFLFLAVFHAVLFSSFHFLWSVCPRFGRISIQKTPECKNILLYAGETTSDALGLQLKVKSRGNKQWDR